MSGDQPGQWGMRPGAYLMLGDIIHGHAGGAFGRDHYECSRVEATGRDWVVARHLSDGEVCAAVSEQTAFWAVEWSNPSKTELHTSGCPYYEPGRT